MTRRRALLATLGLMLSPPALAQAPEAPPPRGRRPLRLDRPGQRVEPFDAPQAAPAPLPPRADLAPVPNRMLEAPRVPQNDRPRLSPDIIHRRLPGRGQTANSAPSRTEEGLFEPAPGARLRVPFSY